jgi:hypothetical protein
MACMRPCVRCSRHVRVTEATCPFCAASLEPLRCAAPSAHAATRTRAALVFAGVATALAACHDPGAVALYGPPPIADMPDSATTVTTTPPDAGVADAAGKK